MVGEVAILGMDMLPQCRISQGVWIAGAVVVSSAVKHMPRPAKLPEDAGGSPSFQVIHPSSLLIADSECLCEARVAMVAGGSWSNMLSV